MENFYNNEKIDVEFKRNTAFQTLNAIREAVSLADQNPVPITYEDAFNYFFDLCPDLYPMVTELLNQRNESEDVKLYRELAEAKSVTGTIVTAEQLIQKEIDEMMLNIGAIDKNFQMKKRLARLLAAKKHFSPRKPSENRILNHDFFIAEHPYFGQVKQQSAYQKDYKISNNHYLRMQMFHPDNEEAITGVDLIYERFDLLKDQVRFVHLQYKVWDKKNFYINDSRLKEQIKKMEENLCKYGFCYGKHGRKSTTKFRMPYCSGFLRPTTEKSELNHKLISTGHHLPICDAFKMLAKGEKSITKTDMVNKAVSHNIFEESFANNKLGSRWMPIAELDAFYSKTGLNIAASTIRVNAKEILVPTEVEKQNYINR